MSLGVLLQCNVPLWIEDWYHACRRWFHNVRRVGVEDATERARRKQMFDTIASRLLSHTKSLSDSTKLDTVGEAPRLPLLYHTKDLSIMAAESAWRLGYRDLNSYNANGYETTISNSSLHFAPGTPIWLVTSTVDWETWQFKWSTFCLLVNHGADACWTHPLYLTSPIRVFSMKISMITAGLKDAKPLDRICDLLLMGSRDGCTCHCSRGGCYAIGCTLLRCSPDPFYDPYEQEVAIHRRTTQPRLFALIDSNREMSWLSSAALRLSTFESLPLSHTCCFTVLEVLRITEEAELIYDIEADDIKLLDTLVAEFEASWAVYSKPFVIFMNCEWKPQMRAIRSERQTEKSVYHAELRRMGVVSNEINGVDDPGSGSESDWPDEYESERNRWYTTDEEEEESVEEEREPEAEGGSPEQLFPVSSEM